MTCIISASHLCWTLVSYLVRFGHVTRFLSLSLSLLVKLLLSCAADRQSCSRAMRPVMCVNVLITTPTPGGRPSSYGFTSVIPVAAALGVSHTASAPESSSFDCGNCSISQISFVLFATKLQGLCLLPVHVYFHSDVTILHYVQ